MTHICFPESSGMIRKVKHGRTRTCTIEGVRLTEAEKWLTAQQAIWEGREDRLAPFVMQDQSGEA